MTLFADRNTDRSVFGLFTLSAPQTQQFNPFCIVIFAPIMSVLWTALAKRGLEPSIPVKFAIALAGVGAGFLFLVWGSTFASASISVAQYFAGIVAQFASVETVGGQVTNLKVSLDTYTGTFTTIAYIAIGAGVLLFLLSWPLQKWMHGVK